MTDPFKPLGGNPSPKEKEWTPIVPVPVDAPPPPTRHPTLGEPTDVHPYIAATGETNGFVCRFDRHGGKEFRPLTYCLHPGGFLRDWRWRTWDKPRPLFNLDKLHNRPASPVLVVEGERSCRAAERLAPGYVSVTSPGGSKAASQADWKPLARREVVIWPDNDEPGRLYAGAVAKHAIAAGATRVRIIEPPPGVPATWDAHDALVSGFDETQTTRLIANAVDAGHAIGKLGEVAGDADGGSRRRRRTPQRDELLGYTEACELWHDDANKAYATFPCGGHREHAPIRSLRFRNWLTLRYLDDKQSAPGKQAMDECLNAVEAIAVGKGERHTAFIRVAEHQGRVYLDLCDEEWRSIECSRNGWAIVDAAPVKFVRRDGMLPLPTPESVTEHLSGIEELRGFLANLTQEHFILVVAWLVSCLKDTGTFPILMLHGESGSGKTMLTRLLMDLIDPRDEKALSIPKDDRALIVFAKQTWLIGFENISYIPGWLSDALCRLASGDSFVAVKLYTDEELALHKAKRPVIVNGIPRLAEREDLASRVLSVNLPPFANDRLTEPEILDRWQKARPRILGGVLDGLCAALRNVDTVTLPEQPRLVGALKWATAAEANFGFDDGATVAAYRTNARESALTAFEADVVAIALTRFVGSSTTKAWEGTPTQLFEQLNGHATEAQRKLKSWPVSPTGLTNRVDRAAPLLRAQGIHVERRRTRGERLIIITQFDDAHSAPGSPQ
jgi:putative DNA primase/helicase